MTVPILVVDDHKEFRRILKQILQVEPDFVVAAEAEDGEVAVDLALQRRPAVVLMDLAMPHLDGFEAIRRIKSTRPETKVVVLTFHTDPTFRVKARESGADAFLPKQEAVTRLIPAIREVLSGPRDQMIE